MKLYQKQIDSPVGRLYLAASGEGLCMVEFDNMERIKKHNKEFSMLDTNFVEEQNAILSDTEKQLNEYFQRKRTRFDLPLHFIGTDFQKRVWKELLEIPYGTTRSYAEQSKAIGDLKAIRAVANANGQNKISIIVPCHRIVGSDGSLTGYGGGLERKKFLLNLESAQVSLFS